MRALVGPSGERKWPKLPYTGLFGPLKASWVGPTRHGDGLTGLCEPFTGRVVENVTFSATPEKENGHFLHIYYYIVSEKSTSLSCECSELYQLPRKAGRTSFPLPSMELRLQRPPIGGPSGAHQVVCPALALSRGLSAPGFSNGAIWAKEATSCARPTHSTISPPPLRRRPFFPKEPHGSPSRTFPLPGGVRLGLPAPCLQNLRTNYSGN